MIVDVNMLMAVLTVAGRLLPVHEHRCSPHWKQLPYGKIAVFGCIQTQQQLIYAIQQGVSCFSFFPLDAHMVVVDIDRGHADGIDGLEVLKERFPAIAAKLPGIPRCTTPHGGLHVFLGYNGPLLYKSEHVAPGLEVQHTSFQVTAPGSLHPDSGQPYLMYGSFSGFPDITCKPFSDLLPFMHLYKASVNDTNNSEISGSLLPKEDIDDRVRFIIRTVCRKFPSEGRQTCIFRAAQWAYREGITRADIQAIILSFSKFSKFAREDPDGFLHAMTKR